MSAIKALLIGLALFPLFAYSAVTDQPSSDRNATTTSVPKAVETVPSTTQAVPATGNVEKKVDEASGLIMDANWELVKNQCTACHSAKQFLQQRATRQSWTDIIRWMQATQGLWKFDPETEGKILDYLANNYAPSGNYRRMPIPPMLMPPNPYNKTIEKQ